jgi:hypothetical protein
MCDTTRVLVLVAMLAAGTCTREPIYAAIMHIETNNGKFRINDRHGDS